MLELALLDRSSAQEVLLEAVSCNEKAMAAIQADWQPNEAAWAEKYGGKAKAQEQNAMSSVKAFNEGIKAALAQAVEEQGLLEMMTDVVESWIENFKADLKAFQPSPQLKLSETVELRNLSKGERKPDAFKDPWYAECS